MGKPRLPLKQLPPLIEGGKLYSYSMKRNEGLVSETFTIQRVTAQFVIVFKKPDGSPDNQKTARLKRSELEREGVAGWRGGEILTRDPDGNRYWNYMTETVLG
jgi:hypothetical protein